MQWPLANRNSCLIRLIARSEYYIDNGCVFSACIDDTPRADNLGFAVKGGEVVVGGLKMFELNSLS